MGMKSVGLAVDDVCPGVLTVPQDVSLLVKRQASCGQNPSCTQVPFQ